jgi:hypothetical protein
VSIHNSRDNIYKDNDKGSVKLQHFIVLPIYTRVTSTQAKTERHKSS